MSEYGPETYGDLWAETYDAKHERMIHEETEPAVAALAELADGGRVLELGIGTGRIALPLAAHGLEVHGIDASERMVERMRAKEGGQAIPVVIGDFSEVGVDGLFDLVYVVFNTFFALRSQDAQVRCFRSVADRLSPDGAFALEAFVPDLTRFDRGQTVRALKVTIDEVDLEASRHDPVAQTVTTQHVRITGDGPQLLPVHLRYAWPSELDLMARLAGLELCERWNGWDRSPFTAASGSHVSIYQRSNVSDSSTSH